MSTQDTFCRLGLVVLLLLVGCAAPSVGDHKPFPLNYETYGPSSPPAPSSQECIERGIALLAAQRDYYMALAYKLPGTSSYRKTMVKDAAAYKPCQENPK